GADAEHAPAETHFSIADYEKLGHGLCTTILAVLSGDEKAQAEMELTLMKQVANPPPPPRGYE
ncbi:hypothetical protein T484DRAFT_1859822, partial [Baffinella frigidus]